MKLYEAGFAGTTVPTKYGGHGGEAWMQKIFRKNQLDIKYILASITRLSRWLFLLYLNTEPKSKTRTHQDANKW
ncbi:MAG: hypothetical protein Ct9H90mP11_00050 [Acidimicrobiales bacterium]|nr:MAG: hypothetical protein Ct9H90mP11_00050 [Acidimicrobiales bacterium]